MLFIPLPAVSCGQPTTPSHGSRTGTDFTFGKKVSFRCQPGYYLVGDETITCQANKQWSRTTTPSCRGGYYLCLHQILFHIHVM